MRNLNPDWLEKCLRLERVVEALIEYGSTIEALKELARPFADEEISYRRTNNETWQGYEEDIFNEGRLYNALGKDDARSVINIFEKFRSMCDLIQRASAKNGTE